MWFQVCKDGRFYKRLIIIIILIMNIKKQQESLYWTYLLRLWSTGNHPPEFLAANHSVKQYRCDPNSEYLCPKFALDIPGQPIECLGDFVQEQSVVSGVSPVWWRHGCCSIVTIRRRPRLGILNATATPPVYFETYPRPVGCVLTIIVAMFLSL